MEHNGFEFDNYFKNYPDENGFFGKYGGAYVSDELKAAMAEITEAYFTICKSSKFISELRKIRKDFQGRPTPISYLERLSSSIGNVQLYVKRGQGQICVVCWDGALSAKKVVRNDDGGVTLYSDVDTFKLSAAEVAEPTRFSIWGPVVQLRLLKLPRFHF